MLNSHHIKINSTSKNMDDGFYALMNSGSTVLCLPNEEYIVQDEAIAKLNEKNIVYIVVTKKEVAVDVKEKLKDATKNQI